MSIMEPKELLALPLQWLPAHPDFSRYARLLGFTGEVAQNPFLNALRNSMVAGLGSTLVAHDVQRLRTPQQPADAGRGLLHRAHSLRELAHEGEHRRAAGGGRAGGGHRRRRNVHDPDPGRVAHGAAGAPRHRHALLPDRLG